MALHELSTNSTKYGALSTDEGTLEVGLEALDAASLQFSWKERNGPPPEGSPSRTGFGRFLLEKALAYRVEGQSQLTFEPDGVRFMLTFPRDSVAKANAEGG